MSFLDREPIRFDRRRFIIRTAVTVIGGLGLGGIPDKSAQSVPQTRGTVIFAQLLSEKRIQSEENFINQHEELAKDLVYRYIHPQLLGKYNPRINPVIESNRKKAREEAKKSPDHFSLSSFGSIEKQKIRVFSTHTISTGRIAESGLELVLAGGTLPEVTMLIPETVYNAFHIPPVRLQKVAESLFNLPKNLEWESKKIEKNGEKVTVLSTFFQTEKREKGTVTIDSTGNARFRIEE